MVCDPNGSEERMFLEQSAALKIAKMHIMMSVLKVGFASNQNMPRLMLIMLSVQHYHRCKNPKRVLKSGQIKTSGQINAD